MNHTVQKKYAVQGYYFCSFTIKSKIKPIRYQITLAHKYK